MKKRAYLHLRRIINFIQYLLIHTSLIKALFPSLNDDWFTNITIHA